MTQVNEIKQVYKHRYALIIAIFGFALIFMQFWFHEISAETDKELYRQFNPTYPEETRAFLWAFESSWRFMDSWFIVGLLSGITTLCLMFSLIALFAERGYEKKIIANLLVTLTYLLTFLVFSNTFNPIILQRSNNVVFAIVSSMICGASSHLLLLHDHLRRKRRTQLPQFSVFGNIEKEFRLKSYDLEHIEYRNILQSLMSVVVVLVAGLIFTSVFQYIYALPLEIAFSNTLEKFFTIFGFVFLLNIFGLFVGVFYQLMCEIHDIVDLVRSQTVEFEKRSHEIPPKKRVHKKK